MNHTPNPKGNMVAVNSSHLCARAHGDRGISSPALSDLIWLRKKKKKKKKHFDAYGQKQAGIPAPTRPVRVPA